MYPYAVFWFVSWSVGRSVVMSFKGRSHNSNAPIGTLVNLMVIIHSGLELPNLLAEVVAEALQLLVQLLPFGLHLDLHLQKQETNLFLYLCNNIKKSLTILFMQLY